MPLEPSWPPLINVCLCRYFSLRAGERGVSSGDSIYKFSPLVHSPAHILSPSSSL